MSLKINRSDFSWSRAKKALPVFLLLWLGGVFLSSIYIASVKSHLQNIERKEAERLLEVYLNLPQRSTGVLGNIALQGDRLPDGVVFARIVLQGEQYLVVSDDVGRVNFKNLVDLSPETSGIWLKVVETPKGEPGVISVVTRSFGESARVQLGKDGRTSYELYVQMVRSTTAIVFATVFMLWPLSLYLIKLSVSPLVSTREKVAELARDSKTELLPEEGSGPELDNLYREINSLLLQNRHLISGMQQSLDNVAHDLRTPMTRLRSVAEYGLQAEGDTEKLQDALADCLEESERVLAMLKIMMSVAEAESGTMRLELVACDLRQSLEQVVSLYEYVAEEKNVEVHLDDFPPMMLSLDKTRIAQVWANLLDNAIKYGRKDGWVKISAKKTGSHIKVIFADNGIGISDTEKGKIWERLYRGDRSRSEKGLGLGLNYVRAVVLAHGGEVTVESELNKGSRFEVVLLLDQVSMQEKSQTSGE